MVTDQNPDTVRIHHRELQYKLMLIYSSSPQLIEPHIQQDQELELCIREIRRGARRSSPKGVVAKAGCSHTITMV